MPRAVEVGRGKGVWEFEHFQQSVWQEGGLAYITAIALLTAPWRRPLTSYSRPPSQLPAWRRCPGKTREGQNTWWTKRVALCRKSPFRGLPVELWLFGRLWAWSLSRMGTGMPEAGTARRSKWWLGGTHSQGGDFLSKQSLILAGECIPLP